MAKELKGEGINIQTLKSKIEAEIAWNTLVKRKLRSKVNISEEEVDMRIDTLNDNNDTQYLVGEILLLVPDISEEKKIEENAIALTERIKEGIPFSNMALKFSQAPGAATGGDLGWLKEGQIDPNISHTLANMKPGEISQPIKTSKGWHILLLRDIKQSSEDETKSVDKDDAKSRSTIAAQLGTKRLNKMAHNYLNDLRAMALIETRL